ncbi:GDSL esterase/lipase At1g29670-like [Nymphaea colorata]|nr:GDSL esterase/lipase At1g29670-like [Nymphaea colorata]
MNIIPYFLVLLVLLISIPFSLPSETLREETVKAMFVFGDSVVDVGDNNWSATSKDKANFFPYGVDFLGGATGRFTNGRNPTDILGQLLGLPRFLPAYEDPAANGTRILNGVNYGNAGSGILEPNWSTDTVFGLKSQITQFENTTLPELESLFNDTAELTSYLSQSIFVIHTGANDYEQRCFLSTSIQECDVPMLTGYLLKYLPEQLKRLYELGARKFVVFSIMPMGCSPMSRDGAEECVEEYNEAALLFNTQFNASMDNITSGMPGSSMVFANSYGLLIDINDDPSSFGFKVDNTSCCTTERMLCVNGSTPCANRTEYVYFDSVHPTEPVYLMMATQAYESELPNQVYPFNVKQLANLTTSISTTTSGAVELPAFLASV